MLKLPELNPGDKISVSYKEKKKRITRELQVLEADKNKNFIVVTNGLYRDTIDKFMVDTGIIKMEVL